MVESFVVTELARQLTWLHYRTKDKNEVDAVIETPNGRVIGIEVKARATARAEDLIGLRSLARLIVSSPGTCCTPGNRHCRSVRDHVPSRWMHCGGCPCGGVAAASGVRGICFVLTAPRPAVGRDEA